MNIDANAGHGKIDLAARGLGFHKNAADLARANQQIVGPAQVNLRPGVWPGVWPGTGPQPNGGANGFGGGQSHGQRHKRQTNGGNRQPQQDTHIKPIPGG